MESSSEEGTISFANIESGELQKLLQEGGVVVQRKGFSPEASPERKRKLDSESASPSKRSCSRSSKHEQTSQLQILEVRESKVGEPDRIRLVDNGHESMQVATIDVSNHSYHPRKVLQLTDGPTESDVERTIRETKLDYQQGLCQYLNQMRLNEEGCDVRFLTPEDALVVAHQFIVRSVPYFASILKKQIDRTACPEERSSGCITVDANEEMMNLILDFMYTGTCNISEENVLMLLDQASRIQFDKLTDTCAELIKKWNIITPNNCLMILKLLECHPENASCRALKEYVLGSLWDENFVACVLRSGHLNLVLDLSNEVFELLLFRSVHDSANRDDNPDALFQCVKSWLSEYEEKLLGTKNQLSLGLLNTLSHRLLERSSDDCKFEIVIPKEEISGYKCEIPCRGSKFDLRFNVVEDVEGKKFLGMSCDFKSDDLLPSWYRVVGFGYNLLNEDCVFSCCEGRQLFLEKDFAKDAAGVRRLISVDELLDPCNSYINNNGNIRLEITIEPDHVCGFLMHYIARNFESIWHEQRESILSLGIDLLSFILKQDALNINDEGLVLRIITLWLTDECLDVDLFEDSDIVDLLACVRWNYINFRDIDKARARIHASGNKDALRHFQDCSQDLANRCNSKPRESYKKSPKQFQAWSTLFAEQWTFSEPKAISYLDHGKNNMDLCHFLKFMNDMVGNISTGKLSRKDLEFKISQEVHLDSSNVQACANFLESVCIQKQA